MKTAPMAVLAAALLASVPRPAGDLRAASRTDPADPKLKGAYLRLHFDQLYPPEAVQFVEDKLQDTTEPSKVLAELARDQRPDVRVFVAMLSAELGDGQGGDA